MVGTGVGANLIRAEVGNGSGWYSRLQVVRLGECVSYRSVGITWVGQGLLYQVFRRGYRIKMGPKDDG
jgi:hypothetical protein